MPSEGEPRPSRSRDLDELSRALEALANPTRLEILQRLATLSFVPDLSSEFKITRQAVEKHLRTLEDVGIVQARRSRRGVLPATGYSVSPHGLFALKERVRGLAVRAGDAEPAPATVSDPRNPKARSRAGPGLLMAHGDAPGRWIPLDEGSEWTLGRSANVEIPLAYDPFASARHAVLAREPSGWTITDLRSRNGTLVDFQPMEAGASRRVKEGSVLTIGHSHFVLKTGE